MDIVNRTENKLLNRVEIDFKWSHKGSKTPSKKEIMDLVKTLEPGSNPDYICCQELQDSVWTSAHNRSGVDLREC